MAKLKVFGGLKRGRGKHQVRTIVATTSKKKAADLLDISLHHLNGYWAETFNEVELKTALSEPGMVFQASDSMLEDFIKIN